MLPDDAGTEGAHPARCESTRDAAPPEGSAGGVSRSAVETVSPRRGLRRWAYLGLGVVCLGLGFVGTVLPVMPTTIFLIIALWAFSRSSPRLHTWLYSHPRFGPALQDWSAHGVVPPRIKALAVSMIAVSFGIVVVTVTNLAVEIGVGTILAGVVAYLLTRPGHRPPPEEAEDAAATPGHGQAERPHSA